MIDLAFQDLTLISPQVLLGPARAEVEGRQRELSATAGRCQRLLRDLLPRRQFGPVPHRGQQEGADPGLHLFAQFGVSFDVRGRNRLSAALLLTEDHEYLSTISIISSTKKLNIKKGE